MLKADAKPIMRKWAIALIMLNLFKTGYCFIIYFQTEYQLVSPLIPKTVLPDIIRPYMLVGLVSVFAGVIAFGLYVYSKYTFAIIVCGLSLVFAQLYFYFL